MSGLSKDYRYQVFNGVVSGSVTFTVTELRKKYASDGSITDETSATTRISSASVAAGAYSNSSTISNGTDKWTAADLLVTMAPGGTVTGPCTVFLQFSPDGGTTWPSDGRGINLGGVQFGASSASASFNARVR